MECSFTSYSGRPIVLRHTQGRRTLLRHIQDGVQIYVLLKGRSTDSSPPHGTGRAVSRQTPGRHALLRHIQDGVQIYVLLTGRGVLLALPLDLCPKAHIPHLQLVQGDHASLPHLDYSPRRTSKCRRQVQPSGT